MDEDTSQLLRAASPPCRQRRSFLPVVVFAFHTLDMASMLREVASGAQVVNLDALKSEIRVALINQKVSALLPTALLAARL